MDNILNIFSYIAQNWSEILNAVVAVLTALIALFLFIPGNQPEKTLQAVVDFLKKFSKK